MSYGFMGTMFRLPFHGEEQSDVAMTVVVGNWVHRSSYFIITPGRRGHDRALQQRIMSER